MTRAGQLKLLATKGTSAFRQIVTLVACTWEFQHLCSRTRTEGTTVSRRLKFRAWESNPSARIQNQWSSPSLILWMVTSLRSPTRPLTSFLILISESSM
ncbi:hypothetical protein Mapa_001241 [Marchantia paleacea]|nr:hypothetical protein Mapa_001241 [Marchantia paleacea]